MGTARWKVMLADGYQVLQTIEKMRNQKNKQKNYKAYKDMILMKYKFL